MPGKTAKITLVASLLPLVCGALLFGQQPERPPISTDRPSVGTGPDLVPSGTVQLESGISWNREPAGQTFDGPESFLRVGVSDCLELQAALPNMRWDRKQPEFRTEDVSLGAKVRVVSDARSWPLSVRAAISVPTGSKDLTSGGVDPSALLTTSHSLPHHMLFFSSLSVASVSIANAGRALHSQLAADMGWCVTSRSCAFVEGAPFVGSARNDDGYTADTGMTWRIAPLVQLDWRAGATIQGNDHTAFVSIGYSVRRDR